MANYLSILWSSYFKKVHSQIEAKDVLIKEKVPYYILIQLMSEMSKICSGIVTFLGTFEKLKWIVLRKGSIQPEEDVIWSSMASIVVGAVKLVTLVSF